MAHAPASPEPAESRLIFLLQVIFVATILFTFILFLRQFQPKPLAQQATVSQESTPVAPTIPKPAVPTVVTPVSPPRAFSNRAVVQLELARTTSQPVIKATGILVQCQQRCFLLCPAELLSKADWSRVSQVQLISESKPWLTLAGPPQCIGDHTQDHQPNMFDDPDLGDGLVAWPLDQRYAERCLQLCESPCTITQPLWLVTTTPAGLDLKRCQVVQCNDRKLVVEPIDRFLLEDYAGCPLIDQQGKLAGNHLGCSIVVISGASSASIRQKLQSWIKVSQPPQP